jgi:hypothetical protein
MGPVVYETAWRWFVVVVAARTKVGIGTNKRGEFADEQLEQGSNRIDLFKFWSRGKLGVCR